MDGGQRVRIASEPFEVWREPEAMADVIAVVVGRLELDGAPVALTTTAELVDVFASKREGVLYVLDAARRALPGTPAARDDHRRRADRPREARAAPLQCAAANWMATALLVARCAARRDPGRLRRHDHRRDPDRWPARSQPADGPTWSGCSRASSSTPARCGPTSPRCSRTCRSAVGPVRCPPSCSRSPPTPTSCGADLTPAQCTCTFPDGRGTSPGEVRSRLARVVCADPEQLADGDLEAIAAAVEEAQIAAIAAALRPRRRRGCPPAPRSRGRRRRLPGPRGGGALPAAGPGGVSGLSALGGRAARSPPRSRCRCSAVTDRRPLVVKVGGGLLRAEGLDGLRRACAEVARAGSRSGPCSSCPGAARSPTLSAPWTRRSASTMTSPTRWRSRRWISSACCSHRCCRRAASLLPLWPHPARWASLAAASAFAGHPEIPESWAVTSDSLAVLAAGADRRRGGGAAEAGRRGAGAVAVGRAAVGAADRRRAAGAAGCRWRARRRRLSARGRPAHRRGGRGAQRRAALPRADTRIVAG